MAATIIKAQGLSKRYRLGEGGYVTLREKLDERLRPRRQTRNAAQEIWALRDVDISIDEGEIVGIVGRNGSGKTTFLKTVARIVRPTTGSVAVRGRVGALLEVGTGFHPELTGRENVFLNGVVLGMSRREIARRFDEIVEFAGVERFLETPLKRYSSGMYLRLAFAVAAHIDPEVMIVDEVLAVGDAEFQARCLGRMSELGREGRTVLFVSHDTGIVGQLCSRAIWLDGGRVRGDGRAGAVLDRHGVRIISEYFSFSGATLAGPPQAYRLRLTIPPILSSGEYVAGLWLGNNEEVLFAGEVLRLNLLPLPTDREDHALSAVRPEVSWSSDAEVPKEPS
jgi:ABC-type polysaccharide/polyol phosphate transport system ATPase subunit